jgi:hypothetical protein
LFISTAPINQMHQLSLNLIGDITERKHRGNPASVDAYKRGDKSRDRRKVLELIKSAGWLGMTSKEIAEAMDKPLNAVSGRCSELKAAALVIPTNRRRDKATVLIAK